MWGLLARTLDKIVAIAAAQRYGHFFGKTPPTDFKRSLYDQLRARLKYEARLSPLPNGQPPPPARRRRRPRPSYTHKIQIDRGGEVVETICNFYARGHEGRLLLVYHHGLGEIPNELSFQRLLLSRHGPNLPADLICYHATGHRKPRDVREMLSTLGGFTTLLGDGMMAARAIARTYRRRYDHVVYAGASLGGIVGMLEAALSASFDLNVSIIAHLDLVHCISETGFRRLVDRQFLETTRLDLLRIGVDADRLMAAAQRRLVMINGIYDDYFDIDLARDYWVRFGRVAHYEIPHGHITACGATRMMKRTLLDALRARRII
jgi:hypothetical protein